MKFFLMFLFCSQMAFAIASKKSQICKCKKYEYKTAPPVTHVIDVAQKVLDRFNEEIFETAADILIKALLLNFKGAEYSFFQIDQEDKCYELEVKDGVFEVEGHDFLVDLKMTTIGTDTGPENTICECVQKNGGEKLDFCNVFLRERIFERITGWACFLGNNEQDYCCAASADQ